MYQRREWSGLPNPSRNTGQGVHFSGELKWVNHEGVAKANDRSIARYEGRGVISALVTSMRPETE